MALYDTRETRHDDHIKRHNLCRLCICYRATETLHDDHTNTDTPVCRICYDRLRGGQ